MSNLSISTTSLPAGTVGTPYNGLVSGLGGYTPYTFSATSLISSLTLDTSTGCITGTPILSDVGTDSPIFSITDSDPVTPTTVLLEIPIVITPGPPVIVNVSPANLDTDCILGQAITITFDQVIDTTTLNEDTFSLTYEPPTQILTSNQLIDGRPQASIVSVPGTWSFITNTSNQTVATYQPEKALLQNTIYTVTLFGSDAALSTQDVMNIAADSMVLSYQWSFTTGILRFTVPPLQSPLLDIPAIDPNSIKIMPRHQVGDDLSNEIDIIFPGPIDTESFSMSDLQMCVSAVLHDPTIQIPTGLTYAPTILSGSPNILRITIGGWPE